jgi:hypothetical protein
VLSTALGTSSYDGRNTPSSDETNLEDMDIAPPGV